YGNPGVKFIIRGSPWQIVSISSDKIYVRPVDDPTGAIPSWVGEEIPVPFEVAQEVGSIRRLVEEGLKKGLEPPEIAAKLAEVYPSDKETILRAIRETVENVKLSYPVPTDRRIVVEDWEDFVILHANFGSLTNRSLAQLLGHILSEEKGYAVAVQHDPYRIFLRTVGAFRSEDVIEIMERLKGSPDEVIREALTRATVKTGIFKRRMIHVARRFGALKKWVDFSNISLRSLLQSFEGTVIYDEALKETFTKDLDVENLLKVFRMLREGEIEMVKIETGGEATPIARLGIERVSMKTDLIPPERMKRILIESARVRLLAETFTFVCTNCWGYVEMVPVKDLPERPVCPKCGSDRIGLLQVEEDKVLPLVEKRGERLTKQERRLKEKALKTAKLISKYGKLAAIALAGRKLTVSDCERILSEENELSDRFFELIIEAERNALKRRFW
ncbi:hypothetical protein CW711_00360, partial [Candidatus Bathyarchaeota archaeon]